MTDVRESELHDDIAKTVNYMQRTLGISDNASIRESVIAAFTSDSAAEIVDNIILSTQSKGDKQHAKQS